MSSNEKKAATLGMPHGTASNRLRKNVLFHLLKKHGENYCFKCSELIEEVEDLSIEHKKPWEGISAELFWDIENIAFSHLRCNVGSRRIHNQKRTFGGSGWCFKCKDFKPRDEFYKSTTLSSGLQPACKSCTSQMKSSGAWSNRKSLNVEQRQSRSVAPDCKSGGL